MQVAGFEPTTFRRSSSTIGHQWVTKLIAYRTSEDQLVMSIVEKPVVLISNEEFKKFTFKDAPIEKVFDAIERAYGIEVVYDKKVMKDCRITTSLDDENLFDKLNIICKLLGASYKIIDTNVVIEGVNC